MLIYYAANPAEWDTYRPLLTRALEVAGIAATLTDAPRAPEDVDYIVYSPDGPLSDFTPYTNAKAVLSLWAGVEKIVGNNTLTQPLCRMVDPGLRHGMTEWVVGHVLRHHLGLDTHILHQDGVWRGDRVPPLAASRPVGILGLGALGSAAGEALAGLGFPVQGWSRRDKALPHIACHTGADGLDTVLATSDILVLLLPQTPATRHILNPRSIARLREGTVILNPGRGPLIDDDALIAALRAGHVGHATLDVFDTEPLPPDHPYWAMENVTVTPHIASATRPETAAPVVVENILRCEAGRPLLHRVDREQGY